MNLLDLEKALMEQAYTWARLSSCNKKQVGAVLTQDFRVVSTGLNGTLPGEPNRCEDDNGEPLASSLHAEVNAVAFAAKLGISLEGATLYVTTLPCPTCASLCVQAGVKEVVYSQTSSSGLKGDVINKLRKVGVIVRCLDRENYDE